MKEALDRWDVKKPMNQQFMHFIVLLQGIPTQTAFSQSCRYETLDLDREKV